MIDFAAIVPVFNPEPGLLPLVRSLKDAFATVVVVDDGSVRDVDAFSALPANVVLLRHGNNRGKGCAMKSALAWILEHRPSLGGAVFADGDGQHLAEDAVAVAARADEIDGVVFGVRDFSKKGVPFRSWLGNRWTSVEVRIVHGFRIRDTQTGLRAVPMRLIPVLAGLSGERFEYEAGWFALLRSLGEAIDEVPIKTLYVKSNRISHFRPLRDTLLTQKAIFNIVSTSAADTRPSR